MWRGPVAGSTTPWTIRRSRFLVVPQRLILMLSLLLNMSLTIQPVGLLRSGVPFPAATWHEKRSGRVFQATCFRNI